MAAVQAAYLRRRRRDLIADLPRVAAILDAFIQAYAATLLSLDNSNRMVQAVAREHEVCRRLMTVLGIDAVIEFTCMASIEEASLIGQQAIDYSVHRS